MRYLLLIAGVTMLVFSSLSSAKSSVDFTGSWTLNESASDFGDGGGRRGMGPVKMDIKQSDGKLVVESVRRNRNGDEMTMVMTYTLDGKECTNEGDNRSSVSTAVWSGDGMKLTISSKTTMSRNGQEMSFESVEIWSLDDGKLMVDATVSSSRGESKSNRVYDKV